MRGLGSNDSSSLLAFATVVGCGGEPINDKVLLPRYMFCKHSILFTSSASEAKGRGRGENAKRRK